MLNHHETIRLERNALRSELAALKEEMSLLRASVGADSNEQLLELFTSTNALKDENVRLKEENDRLRLLVESRVSDAALTYLRQQAEQNANARVDLTTKLTDRRERKYGNSNVTRS